MSVRQELQKHGYQPANTGGGVMAYVKQLPNHRYILISKNGDLPQRMTDTVTVGIYNDDGYPEQEKTTTVEELLRNPANPF